MAPGLLSIPLHAHHLVHLPFLGTICMHLPSPLLYLEPVRVQAKEETRKPGRGKMVAPWKKLLTGSLFSDQLTKCCLLPCLSLSSPLSLPGLWQLEKVTSTENPRSTNGMVWSEAERAWPNEEGGILTMQTVSRNETMQGHTIVLLATPSPQALRVTLGVNVISKEQKKNYSCPRNPFLPPPQPWLLFAALNTMIRAILENA